MSFIDQFVLQDSRFLKEIIQEPIIDEIITSPPYWNLKDYENDIQIGFGQTKESYLFDIKKVLQNCFDVIKESGSMWLIVNNYRKNNELFLLPWEIAQVAKEIGWKLRDQVIWDKQHNLPFQSNGRTRDVIEYVMLFSKSDVYKYYIDKIKSTDELSKWWVDFPERFNPKGKTATNIWTFPIRTGGTWPTQSMINHHCPFPTELIYRIIELSSDKGDVIMDPFAGSGVVLATALEMGRKSVGFDINPGYKKLYEDVVKKSVMEDVKNIIINRNKFSNSDMFFEESVMKLRVLKYSRLITMNFNEEDARKNVLYVMNLTNLPQEFEKNQKIKTAIYIVVSQSNELIFDQIKMSLDRSLKPPFSNYHIESTLQIVTADDFNETFPESLSNIDMFSYPLKKVRSFNKRLKLFEIPNEVVQNNKLFPIYSNLDVDVNWAVDN